MSSDGIQIDATALYELQQAFKYAGDEARKEARKVTGTVAKKMKTDLAAAGKSSPDKLTRLVASKGLKTERRQVFRGKDGIVRASKFSGGYVPTVVLGLNVELPVKRNGTARNPKPTSLEVWRGSEFGSARKGFPNGGRRYQRTNDSGYWFYPAWQRIKGESESMWISALGDVLRKWSNK